MTNEQQRMPFAMDTAREMADAFSVSTGVCCSVYDAQGTALYTSGEAQNGCTICRSIAQACGERSTCEKTHREAMTMSARFGGRYIYFCPLQMMFTASPIISGGKTAGALIAGPMLASEADELLECDGRIRRISDAALLDRIRSALAAVPFIEPGRVNGLSRQLFSNAVLISDESRSYFIAQRKNQQQDAIGKLIDQLKSDGALTPYPIHTEQAMIRAITQGDAPEAARLLNEILGHIFFFTGASPHKVHARITELLVVLSRAAILGGANADDILDTTEQYMKELRRLYQPEDVAQWLAQVLNHFTSLVFDVAGTKHRNAIYRAVDYMRRHYAKPLTLGEVADAVGYSHAYFSNFFKEEMHCSFRTYLNRLRIEESQRLLLSGEYSIAQICEIVGFSDQSAFGKTFKQITGVTPGQYRKSNRRIDVEREHGLR